MAFLLNDFSDFEKLGEGGMGKVYRATQISLNRKVVIKEMAGTLFSDTQRINKFEIEARAAASLDHDNIIRVYDFGQDQGAFYIAMEYVDGPDFEQLLSRRPLPMEIGLMIALQALKGLHFAHRSGIVHCDFKPENILISKKGSVKVADFGIARTSTRSMIVTSAEDKTLFLTPAYMPPEEAVRIHNQNLDDDTYLETISVNPEIPVFDRESDGDRPRISRDIWAAGVLLYRVIGDKLPFSGATAPELVWDITNSKEQPLLQRAPTLPDDLLENISACLIKDPDKRLSGLGPLIESLENLFFDMGFRDIEKEIENFLADKDSTSAELLEIKGRYHVRKAGEYRLTGNRVKSRLHSEEARNLGFFVQTPFTESKFFRTAVVSFVALIVVSLGAATTMNFIGKNTRGDRIRPPLTVPSPKSMDSTIAAPLSSGSGVRDTSPAKIDDPAQKTADARLPEPRAFQKKVVSRIKTFSPVSPGSDAAVLQSNGTPPSKLFGILKVSVDPPNASVLVDGDFVNTGILANGEPIAAGLHRIEVRADGYESFSGSVTIAGKTTQIMPVTLRQSAKADGMVHIYSYPWSEIYIDGVFEGTAPTPRPLVLAEGEHSLILHREGFKPYSGSVRVTGREVTRVQIQLEKQNGAAP
jgi:serine/threonine protein kinase